MTVAPQTRVHPVSKRTHPPAPRPVRRWPGAIQTAALVIYVLVALAGIHVANRQYATHDLRGDDIYYSFVEGQRIVNGENPYARIMKGNMRDNDKYATYLPGFYLASAAVQWAGLSDFPSWLGLWRKIFAAFHLGVGALLLWAFWSVRRPWLGIAASAFWVFNRWSLLVLYIAHLDTMAIFFLVLALLLLRRYPLAAFLSLGVSLAIKQIAVFVVPLFFLWMWLESSPAQRTRRLVWATLALAAVPLAASVPFLLWNAKGFVFSLLFSATRAPSAHLGMEGVDPFIESDGLFARLPMLLLLGAVYAGYYLRRIPLPVALISAMTVFVSYNPVLFRQYVSWVLPLVPLLWIEWNENNNSLNHG